MLSHRRKHMFLTIRPTQVVSNGKFQLLYLISGQVQLILVSFLGICFLNWNYKFFQCSY
jgi:hypothetical protein